MTKVTLGLKLGFKLVGALALLASMTGRVSAHVLKNGNNHRHHQTLQAFDTNDAHAVDVDSAEAIQQFTEELLQVMFPDISPAPVPYLDHPQSLNAQSLNTQSLNPQNLSPQNLSPQNLSQNNSLNNQVSIEERDGYRYIYSNGIPDHETGSFPNQGNPNTISAQNHTYRVTLNPQLTGTSTEVRPAFGVAINGVPFEPGTAEFWNRDRSSGWNYDALSGKIDLGVDDNNAHVQPTGSYHYHGLPRGLLRGKAMTLMGYAADGFPIYGQYGYADAEDAASELVELQSSYRVKAGQRSGGPGGTYDGTFVQDFEYVAGLGDLDDCNGRFGVTPEYPEGIYHYYITEMFPFIPRCVKGAPDDSFQRMEQGGAAPGGSRPGRSDNSGGQGSRPGRSSGGSNHRPPHPPPRQW